jgi:hypothetical protein
MANDAASAGVPETMDSGPLLVSVKLAVSL